MLPVGHVFWSGLIFFLVASSIGRKLFKYGGLIFSGIQSYIVRWNWKKIGRIFFPRDDIIKRLRRNNLYSILERLIFLITRNVACVPRRRTLRIRFVYIIEQPEHCLWFFQAINNPRHDYFPAISCNIVMTRVFFFLSLPRSFHLPRYSEEVSNREM